MIRPLVVAVVGIAALFTSRVAMADAGKHDGGYFQLQGGLGYYHAGASAGGSDVAFSGLTIPMGIMIGHSFIIPGLTIGGGAIVDYAPGPGYKVNGTSANTGVSVKQFVLGLGGFADYYLSPDGGLHVQGFVGWGGLETSANGNVGGSDPTGLVLALGAGYDFFISDEWSFGVMGRLLYGPFSLNSVSYNTIAPAVVATLTYN
jgi:hypothetical protein